MDQVGRGRRWSLCREHTQQFGVFTSSQSRGKDAGRGRSSKEVKTRNYRLSETRWAEGGRGGSVVAQGGAEGLLGGVDHVEEAVGVLLALVHLRDDGRHRDHAVAVDQQEEGLVGVELEAPPGGGGGGTWTVSEGGRPSFRGAKPGQLQPAGLMQPEELDTKICASCIISVF